MLVCGIICIDTFAFFLTMFVFVVFHCLNELSCCLTECTFLLFSFFLRAKDLEASPRSAILLRVLNQEVFYRPFPLGCLSFISPATCKGLVQWHNKGDFFPSPTVRIVWFRESV